MKDKNLYLQPNFLELLFLLFLGLKLAGKIDWSWWWVFAPLWAPLILVVLGLGFAFLGAVALTQRKVKNEKKKNENQ